MSCTCALISRDNFLHLNYCVFGGRVLYLGIRTNKYPLNTLTQVGASYLHIHMDSMYTLYNVHPYSTPNSTNDKIHAFRWLLPLLNLLQYNSFSFFYFVCRRKIIVHYFLSSVFFLLLCSRLQITVSDTRSKHSTSTLCCISAPKWWTTTKMTVKTTKEPNENNNRPK